MEAPLALPGQFYATQSVCAQRVQREEEGREPYAIVIHVLMRPPPDAHGVRT